MSVTSKYLDENGLSYFYSGLKPQMAEAGIEAIKGTQTASTNLWTGVTTQTALYDGMKIAYYLPYAGNGNAATLNLTFPNGTTSGAKNIRRMGNNTITTHMAVGSMIYMTYFTSVNYNGTTINNTWWIQGYYDSNNYDRSIITHAGYTVGTNGLKQYSLCAITKADTIESFTTTSGTGTKTMNTNTEFRATDQFFYFASSSDYSSGAAAPNSSLFVYYGSVIDLQYSFNITTTSLTAKKNFYLVGQLSSDSCFKIVSPYYSLDLPTSDDGKIYILLGRTYDKYRIILYETHPVYWYKDGGVQLYSFYENTTYTASTSKLATTSIGSASAGTAIPADDITAWSAGTATTPAVIDTSKFSGGSYSHTGFSGGSYSHTGFSGGSFTRGTFSQGTLPTLTMAINASDSGQLDITFGQGTLPTHAADSFTAATYGTDTFTAATYGTDSFTPASLASGFYTAGTKGTAPSLSYTAKSIPNISVTSTTVATGSLSASGSGGTVVTAINED